MNEVWVASKRRIVMNRKLVGLIAAGLLIVSMGGCTKTVTQGSNTDGEVLIEKTESSAVQDDETPAVEDTREVEPIDVNFDDLTLIEIKNFIADKMVVAGQADMDKMVVEYDKRLTDAYWPLFEKFTFSEYFTAINETKDENYVLHVENIKDDVIRKEVEEALEAGYTFSMAEGDYYLARDYTTFYAVFGIGLSEKTRPYYELRKREAEQPMTIEEYLNIDAIELMSRGMLLENFIKENPNFAFRNEVKNYLSAYVNGLLRVSPIANTADYDTGKVSHELLAVYAAIRESDSEILKAAVLDIEILLEQYDYVVKISDEEVNKAVDALKVKYMDQVPKLVDTFYPVSE